MSQTIVEMAKDLIQAQIQIGAVSPEDMQPALEQMVDCLMELRAQEAVVNPRPVLDGKRAQESVNWKPSITRNAVFCLECGATFKQLQMRHLKQHGMTAHSYRTKYGIPNTQRLAARATTARRRQIVNQIRPWEKSPHFRKSQQAQALNGKAVKRRKSKAHPETASV